MNYKTYSFKKRNGKNLIAGIIINFLIYFIVLISIKFFVSTTFSTNLNLVNLVENIINPVFTVGLIVFILFILMLKFNEKYYLSFKLKDNLNSLIETNKLYEVGLYNTTDLNGKPIKKEKIIYKPEVKYLILPDYIIIRFTLDGSKYQDSYLDLEKKLVNLFKMPVFDISYNLGYIEYKLSKNKVKPLILGSEIEGKKTTYCTNEIIYFTENISWNYRKQPHGLITGVTGGGKTYILYWLIRNLLTVNAIVKIIDPKMSDLDYLKNIFDSSDVSSTKGNSIRLLRECAELINTRNLEFQESSNYKQGKDYKDYGYSPVFIIFDEVTAFFASCDNKESKEANNYLQEIIMKGRSAGVFIILTTQRADADVISGKIRDQLGLRISMGQLSKDGYSMTFGPEYKDLKITLKGHIVDKPNTGVGFIYIDGAFSSPKEFYAPILNNGYDFFSDINKILKSKNEIIEK